MTRHDVYIADECFLTGTAAEVIPVVKVDGRTIGDGKPGPITRDLMERFHKLARGGRETWNGIHSVQRKARSEAPASGTSIAARYVSDEEAELPGSAFRSRSFRNERMKPSFRNEAIQDWGGISCGSPF